VTRFPLGMSDVGDQRYLDTAVIKRYVEKTPGGRPHIPVDRREAVEALEMIAADFPVFRVAPRSWPTRAS
jgi:L-rhamnose isomerase